MTIKKLKYVDYREADLRFTGWENECIIIDRSENHYLVPEDRYKELMEMENNKQKETNKSLDNKK